MMFRFDTVVLGMNSRFTEQCNLVPDHLYFHFKTFLSEIW